ncbi:MAG: bifunctional precorrin-2 dehydrogenase/sirohydrochlorin ferrochelatase [Tannerella sp.]|jgi:siroheme synthase-like protein|nr:bifunctional precorrin-2 dehydrogenase/sirohydrochlorin ferrochelatase [Tannerella sp.]
MKHSEELNFLPVSVNITGRKILIIGGGKTGYHKATLLSRFTDRVTVVSPDFHEGFGDLPFELVRKEYERTDLEGAFMVYICTGDEALNARIKNDAGTLNVPASVCDSPALCDFISPAIYKEGDMTIAVSSNARNVRRSIAVRDRIRQLAQNGELSLQETAP